MVLVFIKTFQFRHPDTSANVFTAMYAFCVLIFFESISIYITSYNWKIAFHAVCGVFYLSFIIHLSIENYFYGAIRVSYKTTIPILFENLCEKSRHPFRLGMMVVFFIINFILVAILFIRTVKSEKEITSLSTPILLLCSANVALYLTQYLFRKFYEISQDVDSGGNFCVRLCLLTLFLALFLLVGCVCWLLLHRTSSVKKSVSFRITKSECSLSSLGFL